MFHKPARKSSSAAQVVTPVTKVDPWENGHDTRLPRRLQPPKPCNLGVGCDEVGVCFAEAHSDPSKCGRL